MTAGERWREALVEWEIPPAILASAPESPWQFPAGLLERRAERAAERPTPTHQVAQQWLGKGGTVLDVGCGAGAASLPLAARAGRLVGVDESARLLAEFRRLAGRVVESVVTVEGRWPEVAAEVEPADVVVCANVVYNVPDLAAFARALTERARRRVVLELTARHPMSELNPLWMRFHGLRRPDRPTADDCAEVLHELGLNPGRNNWVPAGTPAHMTRAQMVTWTRRRLCLTADRDAEVESAIAPWFAEDGSSTLPPRQVVTLDWQGHAVN